MKRILMLLVLAMMFWVSQAMAAPCVANGQKVFCQYDTGCWQVNSTSPDGQSTCEMQAGFCSALYSGGKEGSGTCSSNDNNPFTNCSGCWAEESGLVWCDYGPPSQYGEGGCYQKTAADCAATEGTAVTSCSSGGTNTCSNGGTWPTCTPPGGGSCNNGAINFPDCNNYGGSPIITTYKGAAAGNALAAMHNAVSLQVTKAGTFSIYDMKGNTLRVQRIEQGSHVVQLQLPRGLYIIKATSGSWQQTVKATVK